MNKKPAWLRVRLSDTIKYNSVNEIIKSHKLTTVCEEANCPNRVDCYSKKTATFMILGNQCTRNCRFCNITQGDLEEPDLLEPQRIAMAIKELGLAHAVITSVTRDDLHDQGASLFVNTIKAIKNISHKTIVEVLIPDMQFDTSAIDMVIDAEPAVINHNVETVPRLYEAVRPEADYKRSLDVLRYIKKKNPNIVTKSGFMLGLGESMDEVRALISDLKEVGIDCLTIGQYLQPSPDHFQLVEYIRPEVFDTLAVYAKSIGINGVASAPLVRSSYYAKDLYEQMLSTSGDHQV
ncbi:Lipoyl synthase [Petrocella atlantisensis]|uniref:Lipoyl synthase n=1 Tax=Petrocella atlantisensis TaxID=2173034 RepID=A0A3P7Q120_9FIRM|nr:lipoyl synthase [Petrocella atlantisensis]VDN49071.1 Lipoyl synthase [Petrocella atlantisensis]